MKFVRQADGYRAYFTVVNSAGAVVAGVASGSFTATVVNPADTASSVPTVTELSTKAGLYTFLVPSSFLATHGNGHYAVLVVINKPAPAPVRDAFSDVLRVHSRDFDDVLAAVVDGTLTAADALKYALAMSAGGFVESDPGGGNKDFSFQDRSGATLFTLRILGAGGRNRTAG